jgi:hypothetical protein
MAARERGSISRQMACKAGGSASVYSSNLACTMSKVKQEKMLQCSGPGRSAQPPSR